MITEFISDVKTNKNVLHSVLWHRCYLSSSFVRISQLVRSLSASRQRVVFTLLVPSCHQISINLLTKRNKLEENFRLVTMLSKQFRYKPVVT